MLWQIVSSRFRSWFFWKIVIYCPNNLLLHQGTPSVTSLCSDISRGLSRMMKGESITHSLFMKIFFMKVWQPPPALRFRVDWKSDHRSYWQWPSRSKRKLSWVWLEASQFGGRQTWIELYLCVYSILYTYIYFFKKPFFCKIRFRYLEVPVCK